MQQKKICQLCRSHTNKFVKSHIIPLAFYEKYRNEKLKVYGGVHPKRIQNGLYGQFLCSSCESKFNAYDEPCVQYFKQGKSHCERHEVDGNGVFVIQNLFQHKDLIHKFALSVLWRASVCGREEFSEIKLGSYQEKIREALFTGIFTQDLLNAVGIAFWEYRDKPGEYQGKPDIDAAFIPYHLHHGTPLFKQTLGNFKCHDFGFPYGEILIRLGGEQPKQGYVKLGAQAAVIWSCNLSSNYPDLLCAKTPNKPDLEKLIAQRVGTGVA